MSGSAADADGRVASTSPLGTTSDIDACWPTRLAHVPHRDWFSSALRVDDLKAALRFLKARHNIAVRVSAPLNRTVCWLCGPCSANLNVVLADS